MSGACHLCRDRQVTDRERKLQADDCESVSCELLLSCSYASRLEVCMGVGNHMGIPFPWESHGNGNNHTAHDGNGNGNKANGNGNSIYLTRVKIPKIIAMQLKLKLKLIAIN